MAAVWFYFSWYYTSLRHYDWVIPIRRGNTCGVYKFHDFLSNRPLSRVAPETKAVTNVFSSRKTIPCKIYACKSGRHHIYPTCFIPVNKNPRWETIPLKNCPSLKFMRPSASATTGVPLCSSSWKLPPLKFTVVTLCALRSGSDS